MKLIIANPIKSTSNTMIAAKMTFALASELLGLDKYSDKAVVVMFDRDMGNIARERISRRQDAVWGGTDQKFDEQGIIRVVLAMIPEFPRQMMTSLLHELKHVEQTASGVSVQHDDGSVTWKGKRHSAIVEEATGFNELADKIGKNQDAYTNAPWEVDARAFAKMAAPILDQRAADGGLVEVVDEDGYTVHKRVL